MMIPRAAAQNRFPDRLNALREPRDWADLGMRRPPRGLWLTGQE
jgi:hypothetical protein